MAELTDEQIMALMSPQMHADLAAAAIAVAGDAICARGAARVVLNRHAVDLVRAAIAADRAARVELTPEEVAARFRAWWAESFPNAPAGPHAVQSHVAFALHLLGGEVAA